MRGDVEHWALPRFRATNAWAVVIAVAVLFGWPVVGGSAGGAVVDVGLRLLLAAIVSVSALVALREGLRGDRLGWSALLGGSELLAAVSVAELVDVSRGHLGTWPTAQAAVECGAVAVLAAGILRLAVPGAPPWPRRLVEAAALAATAGLAVLGLGQTADLGHLSVAGSVLAGVDVVLLGAGVLALVLARLPMARRWPVLGAGAVSLAVGGLLDLAQAPRPLGAAVRGLGLALLALACLTEPAAPRPDVERPAARWALPLLAVAVAPLVGLGVALLPLRPVSGTPLGVGVLAALVTLVLVRQQLLLHERQRELRVVALQRSAFEHQAFHDDLTGLANRALFLDRLEHALELHRRHHRPLTVLFGDLDGFKQVNDQHGHDVGDEVLRTVAQRFRACVRPADTLARLAGDEFVVLLEEGADAETVVRRLETVVSAPLEDVTGQPAIAMSIGLASVGVDDPTPTAAELLRQADERMFRRKGERRVGALAERASGHDPGEDPLQQALPAALELGEVSVAYQPLVDLATGEVVGLEALARWQHREADVPPRVFVDLARRLGLLSRLTALVADRACGQLRRWSDELGHDRLTVSVNLEPEQLVDEALHLRLQQVRERHGLRPGQLVLELSAAAASSPDAPGLSRTLSRQGIPLSLSGWTDSSGLHQLSRMSLAAIKLHTGSSAEHDDPDLDGRLLRALQGAGRELDVRVVVEGIETIEDVASLRRVSGVLGQGFAIARPSPPGDVSPLLNGGVTVP